MITVGSRIRVSKNAPYYNDGRFASDTFVVKRIETGKTIRRIFICNSNGKARNEKDEFYFSEQYVEVVDEFGRCSSCDALTPGRTLCCDCKATK